MPSKPEITPEMIEAAAVHLCRTHPNYSQWHMPGDEPRKWRSSGGAVYDTNELTPGSANVLRNCVRIALEAVYPLIAEREREACAKVAELWEAHGDYYDDGQKHEIAAAIRSRGDAG